MLQVVLLSHDHHLLSSLNLEILDQLYGCITLSDTIILHLCRMNRYDYGMQTQVYVFSFLLEQGVIATKCLVWLVSFSAVKRCMCLSNNVIECNPP